MILKIRDEKIVFHNIHISIITIKYISLIIN